MRKTLVAFALPILLLLASPLAVAYGGEAGDWEVGVYGGGGLYDSYFEFNPRDAWLAGARFGYFFTPHFSLEVSGQRAWSKSDLTPTVTLNDPGIEDIDINLDSARLNALWNFRWCEKFRPFLTAGIGYERANPEDMEDITDLGFNGGGGFRYYVTKAMNIRFDARYVYIDLSEFDQSETQGNVEMALGVSWTFGGGAPKDTDGDGVLDCKDKCPDTMRGCMVDESGCRKDTDGDGVCDGLDACPDTPKGEPVDQRGCTPDTDGDGVPDYKDKCPNTPKGCIVDGDGCPKDQDGDGVCDGLDKCPDTPKCARVDAAGCPSDADGDTIWDGCDKCADTPKDKKVDKDGCPVEAPPAPLFEGRRELILEGVYFAFNKFDLTPNSELILKYVAKELKTWPNVPIEIQGHTDNVGSDAYNQGLSEKRAQTVKDYLAAQGVANPLTVKGFGESQPIATNDTEEGRAKNRRTALVRTDQ